MASATPDLAPPSVRWNLDALYKSMDDPAISAAWEESHRQADAIAERFRGRIAAPDLTAETLLEAIQAVENLRLLADKAPHYANLLLSANMADPEIGAFYAEQMEKHSELSIKLIFLELELQSAQESVIQNVLASGRLEPYRHFIERTRVYSPHRLTEAEEILLEETANTGSRAWVRLSEEITGNHVYKFYRPGTNEAEELTEQEVLTLMRDGDRAIRKAASESFTRGLKEQERVLCFTYNNLLADKKVEDRLRKYEYPEQSRHMSNELTPEIVDLVVNVVRENYSLVARYYSTKRQILGLEELTHYDRYAPLTDTTKKVSWEVAEAIVLESFGKFHPALAEKAREFFEGQWIDAEPRSGKSGGAFCSYTTPDAHPFILMSYLNKLDDVGTLAHELGHGVHASLSRAQSYFNFQGTLPLAELASIFGEMLVFERLVSEASDEDKIALYAQKIEGCFASVFRQVAMYTFETRCHQMRREEGELSPEEFAEIWQEELQKMFGESVQLGEDHSCWWMYVSHFYFAPFYVYAYAFGELLTMSLYQRAKQLGPEFADDYVRMLEMGGSRSPQELMDVVGVDLSSREFWQGGISALEKLVSEFEGLVAARA